MQLFVPNPDLADEMMADEEFRDNLAASLEKVRAMAESLTPRIMPRNAQAFEIQVGEDGVSVVNTDYGGHIAEFGSINNAPYAPLRRAILASGLRLDETPKP